MNGIGMSTTEHAGGPIKKRLLYPAVLVILVVALALGLSTTAFAATSGSITLVPDGPGWMTGLGVAGAAANWSACTSADGDASYVWSRKLLDEPGSNPWDMYSVPDPHAPSGAVVTKVTVYAQIRATALSATPPAYSMGVCVGQDMGTSAWAIAPLDSIQSTKYTTYSSVWPNNFWTQSPWTWADLNDLQIGILLYSPTGSPLDEARCTKVWAVVNYAPEWGKTLNRPGLRR